MSAKLFQKNYPQIEGIYNCLEGESYVNLIKKTEMDTYSKRAKSFNETNMLNLSLAHQKALAPLLQYPQNSIFLELGGGDGRFAFYLMKKGYQVIESDIAPGSVKKVKNIAVKNNIRNGYYAIIDAENLPFNNNTIDAVFIVASLHHFPNPEKAVSEIARVLKQNSHFLILREPAAWQYILFGPIFKLFRTILRHKNKNYVSLADDEATGFSKRRFMFLLTNDFKNIKFEPVHYLSKFYDNFLILLSKFLNKNYEFNYKIKDSLQKLDKLIARIPLIKNLPWDWDVYCQKK